MREAFALQKRLKLFQQKYWHIWDINVWNFNVSLTNDVVRFEQSGPGLSLSLSLCACFMSTVNNNGHVGTVS